MGRKFFKINIKYNIRISGFGGDIRTADASPMSSVVLAVSVC